MKRPSGGNPASAATPITSPQPISGSGGWYSAHLGDLLRALHLRNIADGEEDGRLGQGMQHHMQEPGEIGERAAEAEGEGDESHMLDR